MVEAINKDLSRIRLLPVMRDAPRNHIEAKVDWLEAQIKVISNWSNLMNALQNVRGDDFASMMESVEECASETNSYDPPHQSTGEWNYEDVSKSIM